VNKLSLKLCRDWLGKYHGDSKIALRPRNVEQVSKILSYCNEKRLAVVPQGGNTGLVGGSVPIHDEIVLNLSSMNSIHGFDPLSGVITCDSGCILEDLEIYLEALGHTVPLDLGAKGSCQIGGNLSSNAGGLRFMRYGSLHGNVLGIEVVLADGRIVDLMNKLRKDNTGYDMKHMFIGSEGTLGIITKVAFLCPALSSSVNLGYFSCGSFEKATEVLKLAKVKLGEILSAFEFLDEESINLACAKLENVRNPLPNTSTTPFALIIETRGSNDTHDKEKFDDFMESCISKELLDDGIVAQDMSQVNDVWRLREGVTEALRIRGATYKYDVSIPISQMYDLVPETRVRLESAFPGNISGDPDEKILVVGYGHMGDGNLHLNISAPDFSEDIAQVLEPWVYEKVASMEGSISAEHGIGFMKAKALSTTKDKFALALMRQLKCTLDPNGILNPYKVLSEYYAKNYS